MSMTMLSCHFSNMTSSRVIGGSNSRKTSVEHYVCKSIGIVCSFIEVEWLEVSPYAEKQTLVNPQTTYCTDSPARVIVLMREHAMMIFSFNQPSRNTIQAQGNVGRLVELFRKTSSHAFFSLDNAVSLK